MLKFEVAVYEGGTITQEENCTIFHAHTIDDDSTTFLCSTFTSHKLELVQQLRSQCSGCGHGLNPNDGIEVKEASSS